MMKERIESIKEKINFAKWYGTTTARNTVVNRFADYRAMSNVIIFLSIFGFLFFKMYLYSFISLLVWHLHIMINQLWWRMANIEHHYITKGKEEDDDEGRG